MLLRKKGIILIVTILLIFLAIILIFSDKWLENKLEYLGSEIVGAKVEIDHLDLSLLSMKASWDRLQITHPGNTMKNALETGKVNFDLDFSALLKGRFIIEQMTIQDIKTYTDRKYDGALRTKKEKKKKSSSFGIVGKGTNALRKNISEVPVLNVASDIKKVKFEDLKSKISFHTPQKIDSVKKILIQDIKTVEKDLNDTAFTKELQSIRQEMENIRPKQIKKINDLKKELEKLDGLLRKIKKLRRDYGGKEQRVKNLIHQLKELQGQVDQWVEDDFERVKTMARIPKLDNLQISEFLFGQQLVSLISNYQKFSAYFKKVRKIMESDKPKKEKPPRLKGQDIYFSAEKTLPVFWLKNAHISGETNANFSAEGVITNFSFQPKLTERPIVIEMSGKRGDHASYTLYWRITSPNRENADSLQFTINSIPIKNLRLPEGNPYLPDTLKSALGDLAISITAKPVFTVMISGKIHNPVFHFSPVEPDDKISKIVRKTFAGVETIRLEGKIWSTPSGQKIALQSNLDKLLRRQLSSVIGDEARKAEKQLRKEFESVLGKQREEFNRWLNKQINDINSKYKINLQQVNDLENLQKEKKKELEKEIKKQAGSFINRFIK